MARASCASRCRCWKRRASGWRCRRFPYHLAEIEDWYGETEQDGGWFTLDLGVIVDGERLSLLPILVSLIATRSDLLSGEALSALPDDELLFAALPDGRRLPLPAGGSRPFWACWSS